MEKADSHNLQERERSENLQKILSSKAKKKIIVAGPGTGKTFTFKELLKITNSNKNLAITFLSNLSKDLKKELVSFAESSTFHSYCCKLLRTINEGQITQQFTYYPKIPQIINSDAKIFGLNYNFEKIFLTTLNSNEIDFFLKRAAYYDSVGHDDCIFRVLKYFKKNQEHLPLYDLVVVDEYQDFNELEAGFIDQLAKINPILLVGDDDQAIYHEMKDASPEYIRDKYLDSNYENFSLPYCSRCTGVIINAVESLIQSALKNKLLKKRIPKKYQCFLPAKEEDSRKYPKIIHARCSIQTKKANYIGRYIQEQILSLEPHILDLIGIKFLILAPTQYQKPVYDYLSKELNDVIEFKKKNSKLIEILDGFILLAKNQHSNIGWRIIIEFEDKSIIYSTESMDKNIESIVTPEFKNKTLEIVKLIKNINHLSENETIILEEKFHKKINYIKGYTNSYEKSNNIYNEDLFEEKKPILITSINGSKGLEADYVFILGMNNEELPFNSKTPTDMEICKLIVALTRAKKKCYLISNISFAGKKRKKSRFIKWLGESNLQHINVNKEYFTTHKR